MNASDALDEEQIRADEREKIAAAIEGSVHYGGGMNYNGDEDPDMAPYLEGLADAARIARIGA